MKPASVRAEVFWHFESKPFLIGFPDAIFVLVSMAGLNDLRGNGRRNSCYIFVGEKLIRIAVSEDIAS